ncbi:MAG: ABC-ATPase domain-containing protein, partial [bacterium]
MRHTASDLEEKLRKIEGKGYKAYKQIEGVYDFEDFTLSIDHVQGDPFAPPSRVSVTVDHSRACFPPDTYSNRSRRIGLADFLLRQFSENARQSSRICGIGNSGLITID